MSGVHLRSSGTKSSTSPKLASSAPPRLQNKLAPGKKDTIDPPKKPDTPPFFWRIVGRVIVTVFRGVAMLVQGGAYIVNKFRKEKQLDPVDSRCLKSLDVFKKAFVRDEEFNINGDPFLHLNTLLDGLIKGKDQAETILITIAETFKGQYKLDSKKMSRLINIDYFDEVVSLISFNPQMRFYEDVISGGTTKWNPGCWKAFYKKVMKGDLFSVKGNEKDKVKKFKKDAKAYVRRAKNKENSDINSMDRELIAFIYKKVRTDLFEVYSFFLGLITGDDNFPKLGKGLGTVEENKKVEPKRTPGLLMEYILQTNLSIRELLKLKQEPRFKTFADKFQNSIAALLPPQVKMTWRLSLLNLFRKKPPVNPIEKFPQLEILFRKALRILSDPKKRDNLHSVLVLMLGEYSPRTRKRSRRRRPSSRSSES